MASEVASDTTPGRPRPLAERLRDTRRLLETEVDAWVATADRDGVPHQVPLSFHWDGSVFLLATSATSRTGRNLLANGRVRLALGTTRDVVVVAGTATRVDRADLGPGRAAGFASATGFDPYDRSGHYPDHEYFEVRPARIQAWREAAEHDGRDLMRAGRWLG